MPLGFNITWEFRVKVEGEARDPADWPKFSALETAERFASVSIRLGKAAIIYATPILVQPMPESGKA